MRAHMSVLSVGQTDLMGVLALWSSFINAKRLECLHNRWIAEGDTQCECWMGRMSVSMLARKFDLDDDRMRIRPRARIRMRRYDGSAQMEVRTNHNRWASAREEIASLMALLLCADERGSRDEAWVGAALDLS